jgi:hypothetical protein
MGEPRSPFSSWISEVLRPPMSLCDSKLDMSWLANPVVLVTDTDSPASVTAGMADCCDQSMEGNRFSACHVLRPRPLSEESRRQVSLR